MMAVSPEAPWGGPGVFCQAGDFFERDGRLFALAAVTEITGWQNRDKTKSSPVHTRECGWPVYAGRGRVVREIPVHSEVLGSVSVRRLEYIPALATDNPHITKDYIIELEQKPRALREALLLGKWDAFDGQAFPEFTDDPAHYEDGRFTHVIRPFSIPYRSIW